MRNCWTHERNGRGYGAWVVGLAVVLAAAMLVSVALPSARRYLRLRSM